MATITSFEDLEIWNKAQVFGALIYKLCDDNLKINKDFSFKDQIKRAALSISNTIAEGFEYNNNNDFYRYLRYAKGSCGEVKNCIIFSVNVGYASFEEVEELRNSLELLGKQIGKLMTYINQKRRIKPQPNNPQPNNLQPANPQSNNPQPGNP